MTDTETRRRADAPAHNWPPMFWLWFDPISITAPMPQTASGFSLSSNAKSEQAQRRTAQATCAKDATGEQIRCEQYQHRRCSPRAQDRPLLGSLRNLLPACYPMLGPSLPPPERPSENRLAITPKPSSMKTKTKLDTADTLPAAASRLGVDASLLRSLRSSGSLAFKNGRVDLAMIRAELASMPAPTAGAGDAAADLEEKSVLERRKLKAQYQREEFRLAVARRDFLPAVEVAADMVRIANATRAECLRLLADAPTWEGLTASQISQKATAWMLSVCVNLSDATSRLYC